MFWIIVALLILVALAFVLPSLLKKQDILEGGQREQNIFIANEQLRELEARFEQGEIESDDYQSTRNELEQSLFADVGEPSGELLDKAQKPSWISTVFIALLIPAIAIPVYLNVGAPIFTKELNSQKAVAQPVPMKADGTPDIDAMLATLEEKMDANPKKTKGWLMLGRSYTTLGRYDDAIRSYEKAYALESKSANIVLALADALAMKAQGQIVGRPTELIDKALVLEPNNMMALWLGGMSARQQKKYLLAIERWDKVLVSVKDPKEKQEVLSLITEAKSQLSPEQITELSITSEEVEVKDKSENSSIVVSVSLADELKGKVKSTDVVFVYAKAISGPPMPLAAAKIQVKDLPATITLSDQSAMMPSMKISQFPEVKVGARVSLSGQPTAQAGDFYIEQSSVALGSQIDLKINLMVGE